jgi:hypothetical protein
MPKNIIETGIGEITYTAANASDQEIMSALHDCFLNTKLNRLDLLAKLTELSGEASGLSTLG